MAQQIALNDESFIFVIFRTLPLSRYRTLVLRSGDPTLELHHRDDQGQDSIIATNDNWKQTQQAAIKATGKAPAHDSETATLQTLAPGNYTAILAGKNSTSGAGLVVGA